MRICPIDLDLRFSLAGAAFTLLVAATVCRAEGELRAPPVKPPSVPTFEKLPHTPLPKGEFIAWCGDHERYLFATDHHYVDAYDGGAKISAPSPTADRSVQCGPDGRYIVFSEDDAGRVRRFELETGKSEVLATFRNQSHPSISFSPNMKIVASSQPLQLTAEAGGVRTINVSGAIGRPVYRIVWAPDSSKFFVAYANTIDVLDAQGERIGGGKFLKDSDVRAGWFDAEQKSLFLFLVTDDIQFIGPLVRCRIADWRCVRLRERVEQAAGGGKGLMSIVSPLDRPKLPDDDSTVVYARYSAELRDGSFRLLFRQEFTRAAGLTGPQLYVSPSAATAVLSWRLMERAKCPDRANDKCQPGWILDMTKAVK
ncbi:hypothetical protein [Bradyrhizobium sp. P5_C12]